MRVFTSIEKRMSKLVSLQPGDCVTLYNEMLEDLGIRIIVDTCSKVIPCVPPHLFLFNPKDGTITSHHSSTRVVHLRDATIFTEYVNGTMP